MKRMGLWAFLAATVFMAATSRADIMFGTGNSPANQNIGKYTKTGDTTATGHFLGGGNPVVMNVMTDTNLIVPAAGAARFEAETTLFTTIMLTPVGPDWLIIELNPLNDKATGTFTLTAIDGNGASFVSGSFSLGNGQNRVWAEATNNQVITKLTLTASAALVHDVRQVRIKQAGEAGVPEPSSFALLGIGCIGGVFAYRRRRVSSAA